MCWLDSPRTPHELHLFEDAKDQDHMRPEAQEMRQAPLVKRQRALCLHESHGRVHAARVASRRRVVQAARMGFEDALLSSLRRLRRVPNEGLGRRQQRGAKGAGWVGVRLTHRVRVTSTGLTHRTDTDADASAHATCVALELALAPRLTAHDLISP